MSPYRFDKLDEHGHIIAVPETVDCANDHEAMQKAMERAIGCSIAVWHLDRRVALVEPNAKR